MNVHRCVLSAYSRQFAELLRSSRALNRPRVVIDLLTCAVPVVSNVDIRSLIDYMYR
jgi:hypothetical protein